MHPRSDERLVPDDSMWPLLYLPFPRVVGESTVRALIDAFEGAFAREEKFAVILDGTGITRFPGAPERKMVVDWMSAAPRERERTWNIGTAIVIPSGPMRALVAAFNLIRRPVAPQEWTATLGEAIDWARAQLVAAGAPLNPRIDDARAALRVQAMRPGR
jgi:hypothetical protein